jgi:hypothetical protein
VEICIGFQIPVSLVGRQRFDTGWLLCYTGGTVVYPTCAYEGRAYFYCRQFNRKEVFPKESRVRRSEGQPSLAGSRWFLLQRGKKHLEKE